MATSTPMRDLRHGPLPTLPARRLFTVDEYMRMVKAGILYEGHGVELIEGEIIQMAAAGSAHIILVNRLNMWFTPRVAARAIVSVQNPVQLSSHLMPEPDLVLLRPEVDEFGGPVPGAADVLLAIEVSDTTLRYDRNRKLPLYAKAGILEYWIFELNRKRTFVYREPHDEGYGVTLTVDRNGSLSPVAFPDLVLSLKELFA